LTVHAHAIAAGGRDFLQPQPTALGEDDDGYLHLARADHAAGGIDLGFIALAAQPVYHLPDRTQRKLLEGAIG
jgi:hypothetical protein